MNIGELARRVAVVGNALVAASLFFVLIWWRISAYLFVAGIFVFGVAYLMRYAYAQPRVAVRE